MAAREIPLNHWVVGSSPTGVTPQNRKAMNFKALRFSFLQIAQHLHNRNFE